VPARPTASERGYGTKWRRIRAQYLKHHPTCCLCGKSASVPDHHPRSRRELIAASEPHPDAWKHLRPLCASCHGTQTAEHQPGGWAAAPWPARRRPLQRHPGLRPQGGGGGSA
jgi:5-methylcytosine-specific restriction protein A